MATNTSGSPSTQPHALAALTAANAELELLRARLIRWQQRHPGHDTTGAVSRAIDQVGAASRVLMNQTLADAPEIVGIGLVGGGPAVHRGMPAGDFAGMSSTPPAPLPRGRFDQRVTGECAARAAGVNTAARAGNAGVRHDQPVDEAAAITAIAPGDGAPTSRPGFIRRTIGRVLDVRA